MPRFIRTTLTASSHVIIAINFCLGNFPCNSETFRIKMGLKNTLSRSFSGAPKFICSIILDTRVRNINKPLTSGVEALAFYHDYKFIKYNEIHYSLGRSWQDLPKNVMQLSLCHQRSNLEIVLCVIKAFKINQEGKRLD